jgi:hypothetical protein
MIHRYKHTELLYLGTTVLEQTNDTDIILGNFSKHGCIVYGIIERYGDEHHQKNCYSYGKLMDGVFPPPHILEIFQQNLELINNQGGLGGLPQ